MTFLSRRSGIACLIGTTGLVACLAAGEVGPGTPPVRWKQHDIRRPKPPVVDPGEGTFSAKAPGGAVVLFDGSNLDAWKTPEGGAAKWKVKDGTMETVPGTGPIQTKGTFGDVQLHVEWSAPSPPVGVGQDRGNSGIFLMGLFELQVLDSYKADTYADGQAGAIYGQYPPLFNASRPPGQWQAYDVAFRRPRFDDSGKLVEPARVTLFHNGVLVQNNEEPFGPTSWLKWLPYTNQGGRGVISLQDHDHPVRYRNIWLRELPERPAPTASQVAGTKIATVPADVLDQYTGEYLLKPPPGSQTAKITREDDHLLVAFPYRPGALPLVPVSQTEFDMVFTDSRFTFLKDSQGRVSGVHFRVGDTERDLKRVDP